MFLRIFLKMFGKYTLIFSLLISSINYITSREDPPSPLVINPSSGWSTPPPPIFDDVIYGQPLTRAPMELKIDILNYWNLKIYGILPQLSSFLTIFGRTCTF